MRDGEVRIRLEKGDGELVNGLAWYRGRWPLYKVIIEQSVGGDWWPVDVVEPDE